MLNTIWLGLLLAAVLVGGFQGRFKELVEGGVKGAESAITLSLGLVGIMSLWLGLMRLAERAGLVAVLARGLRPVLRRLFPDVPVDHPAMGAMVMNIAANMLGLNNAATPLGLRAMKDLETLNREAGTATNAMCTFLAINTSSVQLIPMTAVAVLAASGSANPTAIVGTAFLATLVSTVVGITAVKAMEGWRVFRLPEGVDGKPATEDKSATVRADSSEVGESAAALPRWGVAMLGGLGLCFLYFFVGMAFPGVVGRTDGGEGGSGWVRAVNAVSLLAVPGLVAFFTLYAALRGIAVYEEFVEGAKEGFQVALRIMPFLVAMLVAIGMFRSGGGIELLTGWVGPGLEAVGFPPDLLPMALMRPLSGSGTFGLFSDLVKEFGPDHLIARTAATVFGSTETTFYVIAVYFGSVGVKRTRHAVPAGLLADLAGVIASVAICRAVFG